MPLFSEDIIQINLKNNNHATRVKINHHIRNVDFDLFLKQIEIEDLKDGEDEYSFRCQNILMKSTRSFLDYMWNPINTEMFVEKLTKSGKPISNYNPTNSNNFYLSRNPGEATIIFTSLTNDEQNKFVEMANLWGGNFKIKFFAINGNVTCNASAELLANGLINLYSEYHCVFVTANMAARSFSVAKIVNGIMMVNEPSYSAAIQKSNRLSTIDWDNLNKIGNMYWFNFKSLKLICPLYNIMYIDYNENKNKKDIYGNPIKIMLDSIDIFKFYVQENESQNEISVRWTEQDLFNEIANGEVKHSFIANHIRNCVPELESIISEIRETINIDDLELESIKLGKSFQNKINGGKSVKIIRDTENKNENEIEKTKKVKVSDLEIATSLVMITLEHEESKRCFGNFEFDCRYIFTPEGRRKIGENKLHKIWDIIDNKIKNLKWNVN